jgi:hypothetical protein
MKSLILSFVIFTSLSAYSSTFIKCIVPNPKNVLILEIDDTHLKATATELGGSPVAIESRDERIFSGVDFLGVITLSPGVFNSISSKTHVSLEIEFGHPILLNCIKRNIVTPPPFIDEALSECTAPRVDYGNPHRNYDAHFRACNLTARKLGLDANNARACVSYCMKN